LKHLNGFCIGGLRTPHLPGGITEGIGVLTNIQDLSIYGVKLENLLMPIGGLRESLEKLCIGMCKIPPEIWSLSNLEELKLEF
jgi:hypothetical protein